MNVRCPVPMAEFERSTTAGAETVALPPATFSDPEFHKFELDAVWGHDWFCIGRLTDVPNAGDYYTLLVGAEPLIVVRQADGGVQVMSNVCRHRGQLLAEGRGNARRLRCPMHSWTYGLDGQLLSAPGLNDDATFDRSSIRLPRIRSETWEGFIFIAFDDAIAPLAERLVKLKGQLANYRIGELRAAEPLEMENYEWNWKIYADECYHCPHLHGRSWHKMYPVPPTRLNEESEFNDATNGIIAYELIGQSIDASPTRTGKALHPILPQLSERERWHLAYVTVAPNLLIIGMPDKVKYFLWLPRGPQSSSFGASWLFPESTHGDAGFRERWEMERADLGPVMVEDLDGWRRYQIGLNSRFAPRGRLSPYEKVMGRLQDWLIQRYRAAAGRADA